MSLTTETVFPPINDVMDSRLGRNLIARAAGLRLTYIPKNMCSTLKLSLLLSEGKIEERQVEWFTENPRHIHEWAFELEAQHPFELSGLESVAVLRSPEARLTSGVIEKLFHSNDEAFGWIVAPLLKRFISKAARLVEDMTVGDFLRAVAFYGDRLLDAHFRSQATFLSGHYDHLLAMEDRDRTAEFFARRGIPLQTADRHAVARQTGAPIEVEISSRISDVRKLVAEAIARKESLPAIVLSPEVRDMIASTAASRFRADFALWERVRSGSA